MLHALPPVALADLAERLIDHLDALDGDGDREDSDGVACPAGDDDPASSRPLLGVGGSHNEGGEPDDAEAAPLKEGYHWTPAKGPADCSPVRLAPTA